MADDADAPKGASINFDFEKSGLFRVIYVEGGWGGIALDGMIHCALYNQRAPIPKSLVHEVDPETGQVGKELTEKRQSRAGIFREVEAEVVMSPEAAMQIGKWLVDNATQSLINRAAEEKNRE